MQVRAVNATYYLNDVLVNKIVGVTYGGLPYESGFIALQAEH